MNYDELRQAALAKQALNEMVHLWPEELLTILDENAAMRVALQHVVLADRVVIDGYEVVWPIQEASKALGDAS
jgi:hypothetical protein